MKIIKLAVRNFEGLEELDMLPGDGINILRGSNGSGKTSVLEAVRVALTNRGERSMLVRHGADEGLILFEFDNGIKGKRTINRSGRVAGPVSLIEDSTSVSRAQAFLNKLGGGFNYNPLDFIGMTDAEQTKTLLDLIAVDVGYGELIALSDGEALDGVDYDLHPIVVLGQIEDALMEMRRDTGRRARDLEGMADDLRAQVPSDFDRQHVESFDLESASVKLSSIEAHNDRINVARSRIQYADAKLSKLTAQIQSLREQQQAVREEKQQLLELLDALMSKDVGDADKIRQRISTYTKDREHLQNLTMSEETANKARACREQYGRLTENIEAVRGKPAEILMNAKLPVTGLGIEGGKLTIHGLPISELSTGEQLSVAVQIAIATLNDLRVVLIDGAERLDPEHMNLIINELSEAGVQAFITQVTDEQLTIVTDFDEGFDAVDVPF